MSTLVGCFGVAVMPTLFAVAVVAAANRFANDWISSIGNCAATCGSTDSGSSGGTT
jgi:hypothetical protein